MKGLIRFTLRRRITVSMLAITTALFGVAAYRGLPLELLPKGFQSEEATIRIPVRESNPTEVQEQVIRPAEEQIRTIPGIASIESRARGNSAQINVEFDKGVDVDLAVAELRDRMERARLSWPEQVRDYQIFRFNVDTGIPIFSFSLTLDDYTDEATFLVEEKVIKPLEALPGVAQVRCMGLLQDQVRVSVDRDRALAQGIGIFQLTQRLSQSNVEISGGNVEEGDIRYSVRTDGRIRSVAELSALPVNADGLRLDQIATIEPVKAVREFLVLSRNRRTLWCQVYKESTANTVEVSQRVRDLVTDVIAKDQRLLDLGVEPRLFEQADIGRIVSRALSDLESTAATGALLALVVLFFFLRRVRLTLVITLAIPLSLLLTLGILWAEGGSLNMLAMLGITIAIGMLIDNSIVVVENMARYREAGYSAFETGVRGASEVGLAITLSTATTVVAFLPIVFMSGNAILTYFTSAIGLPLCYAVVGSLFVALLFIPLATVSLYRGAPTATIGWRRSRFLEWLQTAYARTLDLTLRHRFWVLVSAVPLLVVATLAGWRGVARSDFESDQGGSLEIRVELDQNFTLAGAHEVMFRLGEWLDTQAEALKLEHHWCFFRRDGGRMNVDLSDQDLGATKDAARRIREGLPVWPGVKFRVGTDDGWGDKSKLSLDLFGTDVLELHDQAANLAEILEHEPGVLSVSTDLEEAEREIHVVPDRERVARFGIAPRVLRGAIEYGIRGFWFSNLIEEDQEIPLIVEYEGAEERTLAQLMAYPIPTDRGRLLPLDAVAAVTSVPGLGAIRRTDGRARVRLLVDHDSKDKQELATRLKATLAEYRLPPGITFTERSSADEAEAMKEVMIAFALGAIFVYLIMGIAFESYMMPFAVIVSIPCSWCGAFWLLRLTGTTLDFVGYIGFIVLLGIVVNNGIVLLDCAQRLRAEGATMRSALVEAGRTRLRPILMTAGTTIFGLLPMAVLDADGSQISYKALSQILIGGLFASTLLTLFLVPILCSVLTSGAGIASGLVAFLRRRDRSLAAPISAATVRGFAQPSASESKPR